MANPSIQTLVNHIRDILSVQQDFLDFGFTKDRIYRQFLPQIKDPKFPCITLAYKRKHRERTTEIDHLDFFVGIHMKGFLEVEDVSKWVMDSLQSYKISIDTPSLIIYKFFSSDADYIMPNHDNNLNIWETMLQFDVSIG